MTNLFKQLVNYIKGSTEAQKESTTDVAEPILSFVQTVNNDPKRFSFNGVISEYEATPNRPFRCDRKGQYTDLYVFTDKKLGLRYEIFVFNAEAFGTKRNQFDTQPNYISCADKRLRFVTQREWLFIEQELYLPYLAGKEKLQQLLQEKQERSYNKKMVRLGKEREEQIRRQREEYCNMYKVI